MNQPRQNLIPFSALPTQENRLILPSRLGNTPGLFTSAGGGMVAYALPPGVNVPPNIQTVHNLPYAHGGALQGHHLTGGQTYVLNNVGQLQGTPNLLHMPVGAPGALQLVQTSNGLQFHQQNATHSSSTAAMPSYAPRPSIRPVSLSTGATQPAGGMQQPVRHATPSVAEVEARVHQQKTAAAAAAAAKRRPAAAKTTVAAAVPTVSSAAVRTTANDADAARGQKRFFESNSQKSTFDFDIDNIKSDDYSPLNVQITSAAAKRKPLPANNRARKPAPSTMAQMQQPAGNTGGKVQQIGDSARKSTATPDDHYDLGNVAGVNSSEELQKLESASLKVEAIRSNLPDKFMLNKQAVLHIMQDVGSELQDASVNDVVDDDVVRLMTLAAEQKLRSLIEQLAVATEHRLENVKNHPNWAECSDLRAQLLFIAKAEKAELVRRGDATLTAGSSSAAAPSGAGGSGAAGAASGAPSVRPSVDEAEIQRLREMQRRRAEEMKNQQANQATTAALSGTTGRRRPQIATLTAPSSSTQQQRLAPSGRTIGTGYRPRVKVVKLVDLAFVFENEAEWRNSARYWDVMHAIALAETPDEKARAMTSTLGSLGNAAARLGS